MKFIKSSIISAIIVTCASNSIACGSNPYIGEICTFSFDYCPKGFLPADGKILQIRDYTALYTILSNQFGGDGISTFAVPNLQGRSIIGSGIDENANRFITGDKLGENNHKIHVSDIPTLIAYIKVPVSKTAGSRTTPENGSILAAGSFGGTDSAKIYTSASEASALLKPPLTSIITLANIPISVGNDVDQTKIPLRSPQLTLTQCIAVSGSFPMR